MTMTLNRDLPPVRDGQDTGNKYYTTRALEGFDIIKARFWTWLFDEENDHKRPTAIISFILGAIVVRLIPDAFSYTEVAGGMLIILVVAVAFLIPALFLIEWVLRKLTGR
jgi:hypothetical protein